MNVVARECRVVTLVPIDEPVDDTQERIIEALKGKGRLADFGVAFVEDSQPADISAYRMVADVPQIVDGEKQP